MKLRYQRFLRQFGDVEKYSLGTAMIMTQQKLRQEIDNGNITCTLKRGLEVVTRKSDEKWFLKQGCVYTAMLGIACGDIAGSVYEFHNIKHKLSQKELIREDAFFTDDTVMTYAVTKGIREGLQLLPRNWMDFTMAEKILTKSIEEAMLRFGHRYPCAGYGSRFHRWLSSPEPQPYNSYGNGSAMRVSYAGWIASSLEEAEKLGEISACVTHNHPEGIKGAKVIAGSVFLLRCHADKAKIEEYASQFYNLNFSLDEIRPDYSFDETCPGSVPQAIKAFLEGTDFVDVISSAISIGGDSDTIAAIAGSLAEVIYPIPEEIRDAVIMRLDKPMLEEIIEAVDFFFRRLTD